MKLFRKERLFVKGGSVGKVLRVQKIFGGMQTILGGGSYQGAKPQSQTFPIP